MLKYPIAGEIAPEYDFTRPSYVPYVALVQEKRIEGMNTSKAIDCTGRS